MNALRTHGRRIRTLFSMMYRADPVRCVLFVSGSCVSPVLPLVGALLARNIVDAAIDGDSSRVTRNALILAFVVVAPFTIQRLRSRATFELVEKSTEVYDRELMRLATEIPGIAHFEDQEFQDRLEQLRYQPAALGQNGTQVAVLVWGLLQSLTLVVVLAVIDPLLLLLPLAALPALWSVRRSQRRWQTAFAAGSLERRRANHYFELSTHPRHADETRAMRLGVELRRRHEHVWTDEDARLGRIETVNAVRDTACRLVFTACYVAAALYLVSRNLRGTASAGDLVGIVLLATAMNQGFTTLLDSSGRLFNAMNVVDQYLWLVDYAADAAGSGRTPPPARLDVGIRLRDVSFSYPGSDRSALEHVDLLLPAGAVVAVIGENGAGKSTLVKLLSGLYRPTSGAIELDDEDLAVVDVKAWRAAISAAFEDYVRFEATVRTSVGIGALCVPEAERDVDGTLRRAGAATLVDRLPEGLDTPLGASLHGHELSGGEWQKLALARGLVRPAPLLAILDEPTSSLDPAQEEAVFRSCAEVGRRLGRAHGTVTLLISHRLSAHRVADLIVVFDRGTIREHGTHSELLAKGGLYAELSALHARTHE